MTLSIEHPEFLNVADGNSISSADHDPLVSTHDVLSLIKGVEVSVEVKLGAISLSVDELFSLKGGDVVKSNRAIGEPLELLLNGKVIARGEIVVVGDNFGVRIVDIAK